MFVFKPVLAGATLPERLLACIGALAGIGLTGLLSASIVHLPGSSLLIVAPMGASAVLIFAVPASPMAQPWPVIGGNMISVLVGVGVARVVPSPEWAAGIAVASAILAMSLTRSLHPPGGASALLAVVGGPVILSKGLGFALVPVGLNAAILTLAGLAFHRFSGHRYPHRPAVSVPARHPDDLDRALADMGDTFDIAREDLERLVARVEHHAARRRTPPATRRLTR